MGSAVAGRRVGVEISGGAFFLVQRRKEALMQFRTLCGGGIPDDTPFEQGPEGPQYEHEPDDGHNAEPFDSGPAVPPPVLLPEKSPEQKE